MGTKTISIMDDAYDMLNALKAPDESFSDEIRRLLRSKKSIMEFAGAWKDVTEEEAEGMKKAIEEMRKGKRLKEVAERI